MKIPQALKEALKEGARTVVLAIIPVLLVGINPETGVYAINIPLVIATGGIAVLRFIDSWLHEIGKAKKGPSALEGGLTRF